MSVRFLVQGSGSVQTFGAGSIASVAAHAVLIGGAVLGTQPPPRPAPAATAEHVLYLLPRDRAPAAHSLAPRIRYLTPRAGSLGAAAGDATASRRAEHLAGPTLAAERIEGDATASAAVRPASAVGDSVFSILTAAQSARVDASAAPIYPAVLIEQRVEGSVQARYVVDTTGHADPASIEILEATHPAFRLAVLEAIPRMRFSPATVDGQHVRQLVEQSFAFRLADVPAPTSPDNTRAHPVP